MESHQDSNTYGRHRQTADEDRPDSVRGPDYHLYHSVPRIFDCTRQAQSTFCIGANSGIETGHTARADKFIVDAVAINDAHGRQDPTDTENKAHEDIAAILSRFV